MPTRTPPCHLHCSPLANGDLDLHAIDHALRRERLAELVSELSEVSLATARKAIPDDPADEDPLSLVAAAMVHLRAARSASTCRRQGQAPVF